MIEIQQTLQTVVTCESQANHIIKHTLENEHHTALKKTSDWRSKPSTHLWRKREKSSYFHINLKTIWLLHPTSVLPPAGQIVQLYGTFSLAQRTHPLPLHGVSSVPPPAMPPAWSVPDSLTQQFSERNEWEHTHTLKRLKHRWKVFRLSLCRCLRIYCKGLRPKNKGLKLIQHLRLRFFSNKADEGNENINGGFLTAAVSERRTETAVITYQFPLVDLNFSNFLNKPKLHLAEENCRNSPLFFPPNTSPCLKRDQLTAQLWAAHLDWQWGYAVSRMPSWAAFLSLFEAWSVVWWVKQKHI